MGKVVKFEPDRFFTSIHLDDEQFIFEKDRDFSDFEKNTMDSDVSQGTACAYLMRRGFRSELEDGTAFTKYRNISCLDKENKKLAGVLFYEVDEELNNLNIAWVYVDSDYFTDEPVLRALLCSFGNDYRVVTGTLVYPFPVLVDTLKRAGFCVIGQTQTDSTMSVYYRVNNEIDDFDFLEDECLDDSSLTERRVLVVVDLMPEFKDKDGQYERILEWVREQIADKEYDLVIGTYCFSTPTSAFRYTDWEDSGSQLEFTPDVVIEKDTYGLLDTLDGFPISWEYDIVGFNTGACVLKTAWDLADSGHEVNVLTDYCYSSEGKEHHEKGVWVLKNILGYAVQ